MNKLCAKILGCGVIVLTAVVAAAATSKTWPENYWQNMEEAEALHRSSAFSTSVQLTIAEADAEVTWQNGGVSTLDTFLYRYFPTLNSTTGFSTMPFGFVFSVQ